MAKDRDNVKTNSEVTAPGMPGKSVSTVFNQVTFDNSTERQMNFPTMSREEKSKGEMVLSEFPCPI